MTEKEILALFEKSGAFLKGHFKLSSGLHSEGYLQCALVLQDPEAAAKLSKELAKKFSKDKLRQSAIIRQLEIIGEAVKNIPATFRKKYPKIVWKDIVRLRDILSHAYFGVNVDRIWRIIEADLPKLKEEISKIRIKET